MKLYQLLFFLFSILLLSCKKNRMNLKPSSSLVVPATLQDFQAILDNADLTMNVGLPTLSEIGSDNYYVTSTTWQNYPIPTEKNAYIWAKDIFEGAGSGDWNNMYKQIYYANIVLDGLPDIKTNADNIDSWKNVKGSALFFRAHSFYLLAQLFAKPYNSGSASSDLGIPLRLISDINHKEGRSTVEQTYSRILADLNEAVELLPALPLYKTRPSRASAYALLARVYLSMDNYDKAFSSADASLQIYNTLVDYSTLSVSQPAPFVRFNPEVLFHAALINSGFLTQSRAIVDSTLYLSYAANDLRKSVFFSSNGNNTYSFKGNYNGTSPQFGGIATDEVFLIRAECFARKGNTAEAMNDLNTLLKKRTSGTFSPAVAANADEALGKVLLERRKELLFRGLRWEDIRRLNKDARFSVVVTRRINNQLYTIPPNDARWIYPIPPDVIVYNPDMLQNIR